MPALQPNHLAEPPLVTTLPPNQSNQLQRQENSKGQRGVRSTSAIDPPSRIIMEASPSSSASISNENLPKCKKSRERAKTSTSKTTQATTSKIRTRPPAITTTTTTAVNHANIASRKLYKIWFQLTLPVVVLSYGLTRSIPVLLLAMIAPIAVAMLQGFARMINYRLRYSHAPVPRAPSHGVVKCTSLFLKPPQEEQQEPFPITATSTSSSNDDEEEEDDERMEMETPLRLLLIGDSLAVGVGQSSSCTPIMPNVIAKELSKELGGRPVMWTCHGTPGASTGWIIRELEKSMTNGVFDHQHQQQHQQQQQQQHVSHLSSSSSSLDNNNYSTMDEIVLDFCPTTAATTDDSSCNVHDDDDDSSTDSPLYHLDEDLQTWQRRLKQQRIDFDPQSLAPFDIAVVLTGSNDLKNACFPFLKREEDSDGVSKQASDYGKELQRLLTTLNGRMRRQIQTIQESVRVAKEKVRESVDTVVVHTLGRDSSLRHLNSSGRSTRSSSSSQELNNNKLEEDDLYSVSCSTTLEDENSSSSETNNETTRLLRMEEAVSKSTRKRTPTTTTITQQQSIFFPMVVLPGMPASALPAFDAFPLRHLAHPMVEIMDGHKRNISNASSQQEQEVLFVDPPSKEALSEYSEKKGFYWRQEVDDNVLLSACDISQRRKAAMEGDLKEYYKEYQTTFDCNPPKAYNHFAAFSADGIHPNNSGYNFWGRYIGNAIVKEWRRKQGIETIPVV